MKINIAGGYFGTSGFAVHGRSLAHALERIGCDVTFETQLPQGWEKQVATETYKLLSKPIEFKNAHQVVIANPLSASLKMREPKKSLFVFAVFEGDKAPKQWAKLLSKRDVTGVLVPSQHTYDALVNAGFRVDKMKIIPHGYDTAAFNMDVKPDKIVDENTCTFLWNKGWAHGEKDRSGFDVVLKAFVAEFKNEPKARLFAHINPAYKQPGRNVQVDIIQLQIQDMGRKKCQVVVNDGTWSPDQLAAFYRTGDFFIGTSKADAFHLAVLEAMACGCVPIISSFGGQKDFAGGIWKEVEGELAPADVTGVQDLPLYEQTNWAKLSVDDMRKVLRESFELWKKNKKELSKLKKQSAERAKEWTWKHSAEKLVEVLKQHE